jgi:hypothetical protein
MFWTTLNANHYALLNLENTTTDISLPLSQLTPAFSTGLNTHIKDSRNAFSIKSLIILHVEKQLFQQSGV